LPHGEGLPLPAYETAQAAGMDLRAAVPEAEPLTLSPGERFAVPTGLAFALPPGFEGQVRPRSGLAAKAGITCLNTPGTIDADYRGEVKVILVNLGAEPFVIRRGERIAQLVVAPVVQASWDLVDELDEPARGAGGFGSTRPECSSARDSRVRERAPRFRYFRPSTSCMPKAPAGLPATQRAASTAPLAKGRRSLAECERVMISSSAAKASECSPMIPPPRITEKPISPAGLAPVTPSRTRRATSASATPRP